MILLFYSFLTLNFASFDASVIPNESNKLFLQPLTAKTLELRYCADVSAENGGITVNGKRYKVFTDKQSAVDYYYFIKRGAPQKVVYYVASPDDRKDETYTFKVVE